MNKLIKIKAEMSHIIRENPLSMSGMIGKVIAVVEPVAKNLPQSFELIGVYEFLKKNYGYTLASSFDIEVHYSDKGMLIRKNRILKDKFFFSLTQACDILIENEIKSILNRLEQRKKE